MGGAPSRVEFAATLKRQSMRKGEGESKRTIGCLLVFGFLCRGHRSGAQAVPGDGVRRRLTGSQSAHLLSTRVRTEVSRCNEPLRRRPPRLRRCLREAARRLNGSDVCASHFSSAPARCVAVRVAMSKKPAAAFRGGLYDGLSSLTGVGQSSSTASAPAQSVTASPSQEAKPSPGTFSFAWQRMRPDGHGSRARCGMVIRWSH